MSNHYDHSSAPRPSLSQLKSLFSPGRGSPFRVSDDPKSADGVKIAVRKSGQTPRKVSSAKADGSHHVGARALAPRHDVREFFCNSVAVKLDGNKALAERVCSSIGFPSDPPFEKIDFLQLARDAYAAIDVVRCNQTFTQEYLSSAKRSLGYKDSLVAAKGKVEDIDVPILKSLVCREIESRSYFTQRNIGDDDMSGPVRSAVERYASINLVHYVNILQHLMPIAELREKILKIMHVFGLGWSIKSEAKQENSGPQTKP